MKLQSAIHSRTVLTTVCALTLALGMTAIRAQADEWDKKTVLTVNEPIQVRDTVLQPGQYVFRLLDSASDRHVVQIFNKTQSHLIGTVLAIPSYRLNVTSDSQFTFWETPAGNNKALRAWYYPGDNIGQEFPYSKQPAPVETASASTPPPAPTTAPPAPPAAALSTVPPAPEPTPAPTPTTQPADMTNDNPDNSMAEPTPMQDQTPAATTPQDQATPSDSTPTTLPKTASPYPLIGLLGFSSLALFGLLRAKKSSA